MNDKAEVAIEIINNTKTRQWIIDYINQYGDPITWDGYTDREILQEVWRSDCEAGESDNGILASMYQEA